MQTAKDYFLALGLQKKLLLPTIALLVIFGLCSLMTLSFHLESNAQRQSDRLGHNLAQQLAEQARQSLVQNDSVSLQVLISTLLENNPEAFRVTVSNYQNQSQIESKRAFRINGNNADILGPYTHEIAMAGTALGGVDITINAAVLRSELRPIFSLALLNWILFSLLLCAGLSRFGDNLGRRLNAISATLPAPEAVNLQDELTHLETTLKPLLVKPAEGETQNNSADSLVLTVCVRNLLDLKSQLTRTSYRNLLQGFDDAVNATSRLFEASRSGGARDCLHLTFPSSVDTFNTTTRAVCCFSALTELIHSNQHGTNAGLSLSAVLKPAKADHSLSQFEQQQRYQRALSAAEKEASAATKGQLLIAEALTQTPFDGDEETGEKSRSNCAIHYEKCAGSNLVLFISLHEDQQKNLEEQLAFLRGQLLPETTAS